MKKNLLKKAPGKFKKTVTLFVSLVLISLATLMAPAFADLNEVSIVNPVDAAKNAAMHNRRGTNYYREGDYFAAIKEYNMAIALNPNSQSTAAYYNNLGKVYLLFGKIQKYNNLTTKGANFSEIAQKCFEKAILQDCMKFEYYNNLTESYSLQGISAQKKTFLLKNMNLNPFNAIIVAIIMVEEGKTASAITLLDDFASKNPDLLITPDVIKYIQKLETL